MMQSISTHFRLLLKHRDKQNSRNVQISDLMTAIMSAILDFENTFVPPTKTTLCKIWLESVQ